MRFTSTNGAAISGALLLCIGIGWQAVLVYQVRDAPDWIRLELRAPWYVRFLVFSGVVLLIWAGGSALYQLLSRRFRH